MRNFKAFLALFTMIMLVGCSAQAVQHNEKGAQVSTIKLGKISVQAVEDVAGSMDISLFSGPLSAAERAKYFTNGKAPSSVNVFLVKLEDKLILVDSGWGSDGRVQGQAMQELAKLGISPDMIDVVILTHMHGDHISGLLKNGKAAFPKARIMAATLEKSFWLADTTLNSAATKGGAAISRKVAAAYQGRFDSFYFGEQIFPGILTLDARGHTPGHTAFIIGEGRQRLIIAGDFLHAAALQFAQPDECPRYDMNPAKAAEARKAIMDKAILESLPIAGMHIPFSGVGTVKKDGAGYSFSPLP